MRTCTEVKGQTLFFFCLWEIFSSVAVFSTSAQKVLTGAAGESVTFPTGVSVSGFLIYEANNIGLLLNNQIQSYRDFKNRLHWNSQNGFFTVSQLRTNDSGLYMVDNAEEAKKEVYKLNVYDKVSAPEVKELHHSSSECELCLLLCSVKNVKGLNLVWLKGSILLNHTNSSSHEDTLSLPLEIQQRDNETFTCVAYNPVSKQRTTVNFTERCLQKAGRKSTAALQRPSFLIILIICTAVAVAAMAVCTWRKKSTCLPETKHQNEPVLFTEVIYTTLDPNEGQQLLFKQTTQGPSSTLGQHRDKQEMVA